MLLIRRNLESWKGLNDLVISSAGDICSFALPYLPPTCLGLTSLQPFSDFTDQGQTGLQDQTGGVWCYTAQGKLHQLINNGISPNGIVLSPDEMFLYVAMFVLLSFTFRRNVVADSLLPLSCVQDARQLGLEDAHPARRHHDQGQPLLYFASPI